MEKTIVSGRQGIMIPGHGSVKGPVSLDQRYFMRGSTPTLTSTVDNEASTKTKKEKNIASGRQDIMIRGYGFVKGPVSHDCRWFVPSSTSPTTVVNEASPACGPNQHEESKACEQSPGEWEQHCLPQTMQSLTLQTKEHGGKPGLDNYSTQNDELRRGHELDDEWSRDSMLELEEDNCNDSPKTSQDPNSPKTSQEFPWYQQNDSLEPHQEGQWGDDPTKTGMNKLDTVIVADWLASVVGHSTEDPIPSFSSDPAVHLQDIDPSSGKLIDAVDYPETYVGPLDLHEAGFAWKKENMTAARAMKDEQDRKDAEEERRLRTKANGSLMTYESEPEWPQADCVVRPIERVHFPQIAEIIQLEAREKRCPQVLESKKVQERDIERMYHVCRNNLRPFVVACLEEEDFLDRSKWPTGSNKQYLESVKFKNSQPKEASIVVGFAFVTEPRIGLLNSPCPGSRFSGQIKLVVHPEHRNKLYGSALLDRILMSVAPYHRSLVDYDWKCENPAMIYDESSATLNRRQYAQVFIENLTTGRSDSRQQLKEHLLDKFDFKKVACLKKAIRTDKGARSEWLDLEMWQLTTHSTIIDDPPNEYLKRK